MPNSVNRSINIYIQSGEAEKAFDRLIKKEQQLKKELEKATDPATIKELQAQIDKLQEPISRAAKKLSGELSPSIKDLATTVANLAKQIKSMSQEDPNYAKLIAQYNTANKALTEQKKLMGQVKEGWGTAIGTFVGNMLTKVIEKFQQLGAQALQTALETEGVRNEFNRLNSPGLLDKLRAATKGTVNDLELMKRAVSANNFQIPIEKLGTLLQFAQMRARETGQSVDYLVDSIVTGIARKSPLILDNLGINVKRVNDEFKKTGDFAQAAFNVVDQEIAKSGPQLELYADRWDRIKATFQNISTSVGEGWLSILGNYSDYLTAQFGTGEMKAEMYARNANAAIAKENEFARHSETLQVEDHRQRMLKADLKGREELLAQAKREMKQLTLEEGIYRMNNLNQDARLAGVRLEVWKKYYEQIGGLTNSNDTIANLQKEIQTTTDIRDNAVIGSDNYKQAVARLKTLQDRLDKLLGKGQYSDNSDAIKSLVAELNKLAKETDAKELSEFQQKLTAINIKFDELVKKAKELNRDDLAKRANEIRMDQIEKEFTNLERKGVVIPGRLNNEQLLGKAKDTHKILLELADKSLEQLSKSAIEDQNKISDLEQAIRRERGKKRLEDELKLLEEKAAQEMAAAKKLGLETAGIEEKFHEDRSKTIAKYYTSTIDGIAEVVSKLTDVFSSFNTLYNANQDAQLEVDRAANEKKKANFQRQLDAKLITQKEYDSKVAKLDAEQQKRENKVKRDQFRRNQIASAATAAINGAEAVSKTIAEWGMPFATPFVIGAGALAATQIALILSEKAPTYGRGGKLKGPSHKEGGMPVINPVTGHKEAEVEGGEVILSKKTVANNPDIIDQLLYSSLYKNGAAITPKWRTTTPTYLNIPIISDSIQRVRMFERGGVFGSVGTDSTATEANTAVLAGLQSSINFLNAQLSNGIQAYTLISQNEKQQQRMNSIKADATMQ